MTVLLILCTLSNNSNLDTAYIVAAILIMKITFIERSEFIRLFALSIVISELDSWFVLIGRQFT